jgi:hypothetical protein
MEHEKEVAVKNFKNKNEDYINLEHNYDEVEEKYRDGVKNLQNQIEEMNDLLLT